MAKSYTEVTSTGQATYTAPAYIDKSHVTVLVDDVSVSFTWDSASIVRPDVTPTSGQVVRVRRLTPGDALLATLSDGSIDSAAYYNTIGLQSLYRDQELEENSDVAAAFVSQAEAEAGTEVAVRRFSPLRIGQAIAALASGGGDMFKATYDPTTVAGDAFDMDNMVEGTSLILTAAERSKLSGIEELADVTDATNVANAGAPIISSGAGAPSSTPSAVGDIYVDTTADTAYVAAGTASSADWKQATGAGTGDLLAANNLSDVASAATAFSNIKQAATDAATGAVELATIAEVDTGTDTARAITPAGLAGSALQTKVDGIEPAADVTDADNVAAAGAPIISSGAGAPGSTPSALGDIYVDTTNDIIYIATDTVSSADWDAATGAGGGDAQTANSLAQFAATTSAQLAGVISDETGSGALVFGTSPTLVTPNLGTPSTLVATNATGTAAGLTVGATTGVEAGADVTDADNVAAAGAPIISSGAGAPASTPAAVGDIYVDTTADVAYIATGIVSSADWTLTSGGAGDLLAANNLSDVASAATAFSNIKQAASDTATGVVELATIAEVDTGTDTVRAITPAGLAGSALQTKVNGVEELADVTNATSVAAAGAIMTGDTEVTEQADATWEAGVGTTASIVAPDAIAAAIAALASGTTQLSFTEYDKGAYAVSTTFTQAHGKGAQPSLVMCWIECTTADVGYSVGDRVLISNLDAVADINTQPTLSVDTTNVILDTPSGLPAVSSKSSTSNAAITAASWKVIFRVYDASDITGAIQFVIDGGGSAIGDGIKGDLQIPFGCTINSVTLLADVSGSIVVDVWKDTYANFPPTDADSITASAVPTITAATKSTDATLTGWTTAIAADDVLRFNVDSATTVTRVTVVLDITKT